MEKSLIVVKKNWGDANIQLLLTNKDLSISIGLEEYLKALVTEMSGVALVMTKSGLLNALTIANNKVISGLKDESRKIMT